MEYGDVVIIMGCSIFYLPKGEDKPSALNRKPSLSARLPCPTNMLGRRTPEHPCLVDSGFSASGFGVNSSYKLHSFIPC